MVDPIAVNILVLDVLALCVLLFYWGGDDKGGPGKWHK
jgi:hypothetical protein